MDSGLFSRNFNGAEASPPHWLAYRVSDTVPYRPETTRAVLDITMLVVSEILRRPEIVGVIVVAAMHTRYWHQNPKSRRYAYNENLLLAWQYLTDAYHSALY